ncbi:MAG: amidase family protein, partial [Pseudomonadota bacterium]
RYNHCGFLGRTVSDCALGQNIVSGPHPRDHDSLRDRVVIPDRFDDRPLRIAFSMDLGYLPVDGDVRANTEAALDVFRAAGCQVKAVDLGWDARVDVAAMTWYLTMHFGRAPLWALDRYRNQMTDYAVATAEAAARLQPDEIARSWDVQHQMQQGFGAIMEDHDVFLCP